MFFDNIYQNPGVSCYIRVRTSPGHDWFPYRKVGGEREGGGRDVCAAGESSIVMQFCLVGLNQVTWHKNGAINNRYFCSYLHWHKALETRPPVDLYSEEEQIQWPQHVDSASKGRTVRTRTTIFIGSGSVLKRA